LDVLQIERNLLFGDGKDLQIGGNLLHAFAHGIFPVPNQGKAMIPDLNEILRIFLLFVVEFEGQGLLPEGQLFLRMDQFLDHPFARVRDGAFRNGIETGSAGIIPADGRNLLFAQKDLQGAVAVFLSPERTFSLVRQIDPSVIFLGRLFLDPDIRFDLVKDAFRDIQRLQREILLLIQGDLPPLAAAVPAFFAFTGEAAVVRRDTEPGFEHRMYLSNRKLL
jgi:hypothetical protein